MKKMLLFTFLVLLAGCGGAKDSAPSELDKAKAILEEQYQLVKQLEAGDITMDKYNQAQPELSRRLVEQAGKLTFEDRQTFDKLYRQFNDERLNILVDRSMKEKEKAKQSE